MVLESTGSGTETNKPYNLDWKMQEKDGKDNSDQELTQKSTKLQSGNWNRQVPKFYLASETDNHQKTDWKLKQTNTREFRRNTETDK